MAMPVTIPRYIVDDLDRFPEDGNRYELLDGVLLVTPSPGVPHQIVAQRLASALHGLVARWPDVHVVAPGTLIRRPRHQLLPDVMVFRAPTPAIK